MTAEAPDMPLDDVRRRAAERLSLEPGASPAQARAVLREKLEGVDFVPPPAWQYALELLGGRRPDAAPRPEAVAPFLLEAEEELGEEVEEFAAGFFDLAPAGRRARWQELVERCAGFPMLRARLRALEPGLQVVPPDLPGEPAVRDLVRRVCALFALRPAERAARRRELLQAFETDVTGWEAAARRLRDRFPGVAALEPYLVARLASWSSVGRRLEERRKRVPARVAAAALAASTARRPPARRTPAWPVWVVFVVVGGLVRALFSGGSHSDLPRNYDLPTIHFDTQLMDPEYPRRMSELFRQIDEIKKLQDGETRRLPLFPPGTGREGRDEPAGRPEWVTEPDLHPDPFRHPEGEAPDPDEGRPPPAEAPSGRSTAREGTRP